MEPRDLRQIKSLALLAMFSDDELMGRLVLKGGNLLDLVYGVAQRASVDLDFSIDGDFCPDEQSDIERRITAALRRTFAQSGYTVFDVRLDQRPQRVSEDLRDFWGGTE